MNLLLNLFLWGLDSNEFVKRNKIVLDRWLMIVFTFKAKLPNYLLN